MEVREGGKLMSNKKIIAYDESDNFIWGTFKNKKDLHSALRETFKMNSTYSDKDFEINNPLGDISKESYLNSEIEQYLDLYQLQLARDILFLKESDND